MVGIVCRATYGMRINLPVAASFPNRDSAELSRIFWEEAAEGYLLPRGRLRACGHLIDVLPTKTEHPETGKEHRGRNCGHGLTVDKTEVSVDDQD